MQTFCHESTSSAPHADKNGKEDMHDVAGGGAGDFMGYTVGHDHSQKGSTLKLVLGKETSKSERFTGSKESLP